MNKTGSILKKLREENELKGNEVVERLKDLGFEISVKTLYGYESGRNSTNADMFLALCKIYKCQNIMEVFSNSVDDVLFTNREWEMIEKYRVLDAHGKEMVDFTLQKEWGRSKEEKKADCNVVPIIKEPKSDYLAPNAAHPKDDATPEERQAGDAIMTDDSEWE